MTDTLPMTINPGDLGHIDDHEEIDELLSRLDGQTDFLATGAYQDIVANRPAAAADNLGLFFAGSDGPSLSYSTGTDWLELLLANEPNTFTAPQTFSSDAFFGSGKPWVDVLADGTVYGDDGHDDSAALTAIHAANPTKLIYYPTATYKLVAGGIVFVNGQEVCFGNAVLHSVFAGAAVQLRSEVDVHGRVVIDCDDTASSIGLRFGVDGLDCQRASWDWVRVIDADVGVSFSVDTTGSCYLNFLGKARVDSCRRGMQFVTTTGTVKQVNGNHVGHATITNCSEEAVYVELAEGTTFDFLEMERNATTNGYWALNIVSALGFYCNGGWFEGNLNVDTTRRTIKIGNDPLVVGVYICAHMDMNRSDSADFSYTYSNNRTVMIRDSQFLNELGRMSAATLLVGPNGLPADNQSALGRMAVASGMTLYQYSLAQPYFYFQGNAAGMGFIFSAAGVTIFEADGSASANASNVALLVNNGSVVSRRVQIGAADSAGAGFRSLRVLN